MTLNDFITLQKQYTKHELCQNMAETLVATTKERLYRHSHKYNWTISYLEHTDKNKVFLITKKNKTFPEIWVSSTYTRYRAAFKKYLKEFFAIDNIPFDFHSNGKNVWIQPARFAYIFRTNGTMGSQICRIFRITWI